jgi:hypothetical protein
LKVAKKAATAAKKRATDDKVELAHELQEVCAAVTSQAILIEWSDGNWYGATVGDEFTSATITSIKYDSGDEELDVDLWGMVRAGSIQFVDGELNAWVGYLLYSQAVQKEGADFACWDVAEDLSESCSPSSMSDGGAQLPFQL